MWHGRKETITFLLWHGVLDPLETLLEVTMPWLAHGISLTCQTSEML